MSQQIRINKTQNLQKILDFYKPKYRLFNEATIIKILLSQRFYEDNQELDYSEPTGKELLHQASRSFGVYSDDNEPDNFATNLK